MPQIDLEKIKKEKPEPILEPEKKKLRENHLLPYLLGILAGIFFIFVIVQLQNILSIKRPKTIQPTEIGKEKITEESTEAVTESEKLAQESAKEEKSVTPPAFNKSKVTIQVLNGNGIRGDAYRIKVLLEKNGFRVATYGNAGSFNYQNTIVYYKEGQEEAGRAVEEILRQNGRQTKLEKSDTLKRYDVLVIVGKK